ncbi:hypothetical protein [Pandoraea sp. ISTKB]|uniref:hypothetical protein n=1 Tax=Pandoraea sp. ISTKB TaxID=1586708 RepID=UPI00147C1F84|nr:hypothetical protein [Pandoraea sp. ISTKB]
MSDADAKHEEANEDARDGKLGNALDSQCRRAIAPPAGDLCKGLSTVAVDILAVTSGNP